MELRVLQDEAGPGAGESLPLVETDGAEKQEQTEAPPDVVEAGRQKQKQTKALPDVVKAGRQKHDEQQVAGHMVMEQEQAGEGAVDQQQKERRQR